MGRTHPPRANTATYASLKVSLHWSEVHESAVQADWVRLPPRAPGSPVDNGPEYISQVFVDWCDENDVALKYIQPGKPNQNVYIERFNRTYRNEVLNAYFFESLSQVRVITRRWIKQYNEERPHSSLAQMQPAMFRRQVENAGNSNFELSH